MIQGMRAAVHSDSFLARCNPSLKLIVVAGYVLLATVLFDLRALALLIGLALVAAWRLGRVPLATIGRGLMPFALLGLGYIWMNALFPRAGTDPAVVLFELGPLRATQAGLLNGIVVFVRAICFGACSILFVATTHPAAFVVSLAQQLRLSPRVAYGVLAAYRFLPVLHDALAQIRAAHQLRGVGERGGLAGRVEQARRYTVPLLATAIRDAGRIAVAMESRAFSGDRSRTWYRQLAITRADWLFAAGALTALVPVLLIEYLQA